MIDSPPRPSMTRSIVSLLAFGVIVHLGYLVRVGLSPLDVGPRETDRAEAVARLMEEPPGAGRASPYEQLAAWAAWPFVSAGADRLGSALMAGRALSVLGTLMALASAFGLARLDGASRRTGWLAVALLATSPVLGGLATTLRPEALASGVQSVGAWVVLNRMFREGGGDSKAGQTLALGERGWTWVVLLAGAAILGCGLVGMQGWGRVWLILGPLGWKSAGLVAVAAACGIPSLADFADRARAVIRHWSGASATERGRREAAPFEKADAALGFLLVIDLGAVGMVGLRGGETSYNDALPAIVLGAVLVGRMLDRVLTASGERLDRLVPVSVAVMVLLMTGMRAVETTEKTRKKEAETLNAVLGDSRLADCPARGRYFVERPQFNRLAGRPGTLRAALHDGPVRQVVVPGERPGMAESLPELGYRRVATHGDLSVWERR